MLTVLLRTAASANAFIDPPLIETNPVYADQPVIFSVRSGECDVVQAPGGIAEDRWRELERNGKMVRVTVRAIVSSIDDPEFCSVPAATHRFSLGVFAPGTYTLELFRRNIDVAGDVRLVGTVQFQVLPPRPLPVPSIDLLGAATLVLLIVVHSRRALRVVVRRRTAR